MKFSIQNAFSKCLPLLDANNAKEPKPNYFIRKMDPDCCAWDRGAYLQLYLVECEFTENGVSPAGLSNLAVTYSSRTQGVKRSDGTHVEFPVIDFYLFINKEIFDVLPAMRFYRARCIAHELLILECHANNWGTMSDSGTPNSFLPTKHHEDELLCPFERIEETLCSIDQEFGLKVHRQSDFTAMLSTPAGDKFLQGWRNQCVDDQTCITRTVLYLSCADRATLKDRISRVFQQTCHARHKEVSSNEMKMQIKVKDDLFKALLEQSRREIGDYVTEPYVKFLTHRFIDLHWEDFRLTEWPAPHI